MALLKFKLKDFINFEDDYTFPELMTIKGNTYTGVSYIPGDSFIGAFPVLDELLCDHVHINIDDEIAEMLEHYKDGTVYRTNANINNELNPNSEVSFWRLCDKYYFFFQKSQQFVELGEHLYDVISRRNWRSVGKSLDILISYAICKYSHNTDFLDYILEELPIQDSVDYFKRNTDAIEKPYKFKEYLSPLAYKTVFPYPKNINLGLKPIEVDKVYKFTHVPISFEVYKKTTSGEYEKTDFIKTFEVSSMIDMFEGFWELEASEYRIDLEYLVPVFVDVPDVDLFNPYLYLGDIPGAPYDWVFLGDGSVINDHDNPDDLWSAEIGIWKSQLI